MIEEKKESPWLKILRWFVSPMSLLLIAASVLSFYDGKTFDGWFILALLAANFLISRWHESKADQAIATLKSKLAVKVQAKRDGDWKTITADQLVPGDVVQLGVGNALNVGTYTITMTALINDNFTGNLAMSADITSSTFDPNTGNNTASDTIVDVQPVPGGLAGVGHHLARTGSRVFPWLIGGVVLVSAAMLVVRYRRRMA